MNTDLLDEMRLTDKQRLLVTGLSEKRRKISQLESSISSKGGSSSVLSRTSGLESQILKLQEEVEDMERSLMTSLGAGDTEAVKRRMQELDVIFDLHASENFLDEFAELSKRHKSSAYPDIPTLSQSENLESVRGKLEVLRDLQSKLRDSIGEQESEKAQTELPNDDEEEVDPLEAFMAETSAELANQEISKSSEKLTEVERALAEFEKLESLLCKNQFADNRLEDALKQQEKILQKQRESQNATSQSSAHDNTSRGQGTVWEDEFKKDESVPVRLEPRVDKSLNSSLPSVKLNGNKAGLFVPGQEPKPAGQSATAQILASSSESSEQRQAELRKKLGY